MKVIGISGNYGRQEENLKPTVYLMSDSSLLKDGKPFFIPDFATSFEFSPSLVLHVNRLGKNISRKFAHRYYDEVTVGLAVKACGMKDVFDGEDAGALALAFDGAAILGNFVKKEFVDINFGQSHKFNLIIGCADRNITDRSGRNNFALRNDAFLLNGVGELCYIIERKHIVFRIEIEYLKVNHSVEFDFVD